MTTNWLTSREMEAWRNYVETYGHLIAAIERDLDRQSLTLGDYQVFVYLSEATDHSLRMCDLADRLHLSPSGVTRRLDGLVAAGFVTREASADDRRVMLAKLTDSGFAALENAAPEHVMSVRRHIFDRLDDDQVDAMASIFRTIHEGLTQ